MRLHGVEGFFKNKIDLTVIQMYLHEIGKKEADELLIVRARLK